MASMTTVYLPQQKHNQEALEEFSGQYPRYGHTAEAEVVENFNLLARLFYYTKKKKQ